MADARRTLDRFFRSLVEEIRDRHPEYLSSSFTVAEIYQNLVPYRTHRDLLGVEMNSDYEDTLLRLLSGEGEYLVLESEPARRTIQAELRSKNPNTTIYREFAAAEVRLAPSRIPAAAVGALAGRGSDREATSVPPGGRVEPVLELELGGEPEASAPEPPGKPAPQPKTPPPPVISTGVGSVRGASRDEVGVVLTTRVPPPPEPPPPPPRPASAPPSRPSSVVGSGEVASRGVPASPPPPSPRSPASTPEPDASSKRTPPDHLARLEAENERLRRVVVDQAMEIQALRARLHE